MFKKESDFEKALIELLYTDKGWEKDVLRYPTEQDLIQNWANILFENNRDIDRLNDTPLSDGEMGQILDQIKTLRTPRKLNGFINGKTITIKRDNPEDKLHFNREISLKIYDRQEIAAGQSRYQIAEQPVFPSKSKLLHDRRGDFVLLINGMPVIHVELKKSGIPVSQACHQIELYYHEGVFTGLFSLVQIFVAMEPNETLYFANPGPDGKFNSDFYFHWADYNNEPLNYWKEIAEHLLSIPRAHEMIGFYTVADDTDDTLKVLRSYQFFAASSISDRVARRKWDEPDQRGGYIWHTTGSGKTLTSFKSAQLVANSGNADKVVFLVDRIELGTQSFQDYKGFADDDETVQDTKNTWALISKLKSDARKDLLILTSIQKMSRIKEDSSYNAKDIELINRKRIVFIVDEAHRDVFGDMLNSIKDTFPSAMFFGFTGTPIHIENQKKLSTTSDVFGNELHRYSIADGIRDENVLGFDPTMIETYKSRDLRKQVALEKAKASSEEEAISDAQKAKIYYKYMNVRQVPMAGYRQDDGKYIKGIEDYVPSAQYTWNKETGWDRHPRKVVEDICENWMTLSRGGKFHAIFATNSIPEAIHYYDLFRNSNPDLKVAALFDQNIDNSGGAKFKEDAVEIMLRDYNERYGQNFKLATYASYKQDVSLRLAHKFPYVGIENCVAKQLDILIVVDQMLTGFDSKWINTLYLDKVLQYEHVIQAFSRTNRLFGPEKPFGIIRYYRYPYTMKRNIDDAFKLYSGDRPLGLFADKLEKNLNRLNKIFDEISDLFASSGVKNFETLPDEKVERAKFAKMFKEFNAYLEAAFIQGFSWRKLVYKITGIDKKKHTITLHFDETTYLILALRYKELFTTKITNGDDIPYEIETYLTEINTGCIDKQYMNARFKKYLKALQDDVKAEDVLNELHKSFAVLTQEEQKYANMFLSDVQRGNIKVDEDKSLSDYITEYQAEAMNDRIHKFAVAIGLSEVKLREFMKHDISDGKFNEYGAFNNLIDSVDKCIAKAYFEQIEGHPIKMFRIPAKIDKAIRQFVLSGRDN